MECTLLHAQKKLMESLMAADKWRTAFKEVASLVGFSVIAGREMDTQVRRGVNVPISLPLYRNWIMDRN